MIILLSTSVPVSFCMFPCSKEHYGRAYLDIIQKKRPEVKLTKFLYFKFIVAHKILWISKDVLSSEFEMKIQALSLKSLYGNYCTKKKMEKKLEKMTLLGHEKTLYLHREKGKRHKEEFLQPPKNGQITRCPKVTLLSKQTICHEIPCICKYCR